MKLIFTFLGNSITILLLIYLAWGCKFDQSIDLNNSYQEPLKRALDYYDFANDLDRWIEKKALVQDSASILGSPYSYYGGYYYYNQVIEDTSYWLAFEYYTSSYDTVFVPNEFYKRYEDQFFQYILLFGENGDTSFLYKASLYADLHKIFIKGKYYYQYLFGELTPGQLEYFRLNRDSLIRINGNNLVNLPEYTILE